MQCGWNEEKEENLDGRIKDREESTMGQILIDPPNCET